MEKDIGMAGDLHSEVRCPSPQLRHRKGLVQTEAECPRVPQRAQGRCGSENLATERNWKHNLIQCPFREIKSYTSLVTHNLMVWEGLHSN